MGSNTFGRLFQMHTFGESHGPALGVIVDGMPSGLEVHRTDLQKLLNRRKPGQSSVTTQRKEEDEVEILSGVFENKTLGTPICCIVRNTGQRSQDYDQMPDRVGHADQVWREKFKHVDRRGGGRTSGRETLSRVIAGYFAEVYVRSVFPLVQVQTFAQQMGPFQLNEQDLSSLANLEDFRTYIDQFVTRFPSLEQQNNLIQLLEKARAEGLSYGGVVSSRVLNLPAGVGEPVFAKLKSEWASAMMSIGATVGFEVGDGFSLTLAEGSELYTDEQYHRLGGLRGGMSTGERLSMNVAFKPTSSVKDVAQKGRHDPCIVPRAVPVVEAMTWIVLADLVMCGRIR